MTIIYEGRLETTSDAFFVQVLDESYIKQMLEIQEEALNILERSELLEPVTEIEFREHIRTGSLMIGAFVEDRLIAFRTLLIPKKDEAHIGYDIGLNEDELDDVIYQEITVVKPRFRGNRLQKLLGEIIMKELERTYPNRFKYVCCTVSPHNLPSMKDKFKQKMVIVSLKDKYGGKLRFIFTKEIGKDIAYHSVQLVELHDYATQQKLFKEGLIGIKLVREEENYYIQFGKEKNA